MGKIILSKTKCMLCNKEAKPLFAFPCDPNRFSLWLKNIQKEDLLITLSKEYIKNNARLCNLHFKDEAFNSTLKLKLLKISVPFLVEEKSQISSTESLDCNSENSSFLSKPNYTPVEKTNLFNSQIVEKSFTTSTSSSKVNERTQKTHSFSTNLTNSKIVEDSLVTVITLCCTDRKEGVAFHKFLQDPEQRKHWISTVKHKNLKPSHISVLCPKHFSSDQIDCHSALKVRLKENTEPNILSSDSLNLQKEAVHLQKWKEVIPVDYQEITAKAGMSELHCDPKEIEKIYVEVTWNEYVNKTTKQIHPLQAGTIPSILSNIPISLPHTSRKQFVNNVVPRENLKSSTVRLATDTESRKKVSFSDNSEVKQMDILNSPSDMETQGIVLVNSFTTTESEGGTETINSTEGEINSNDFQFDTELPERINTAVYPKIIRLGDGIDPFHFQKVNKIKEGISYYKYTGSIAVPNEWWGITHTPQYLICSKWNEFYDLIFRVVIANNNSAKIFIKSRECVNENRKVSFENISSLLQEVDSYKICAGVDDKSMIHCRGHVESEQQFSIWCKECQKLR